MTDFKKINDYTLRVVEPTEQGGTLSRDFNFEAREIVYLYERKFAPINAPAASLTATVLVQKFSECASGEELSRMRKELLAQGGTPPEEVLVKHLMPVLMPELRLRQRFRS